MTRGFGRSEDGKKGKETKQVQDDVAVGVTGGSRDLLKRRRMVGAYGRRSFVRDGEADTDLRRGRLMETMTRIGQLGEKLPFCWWY
jgi:hypothetical protein